MPVETPDTAATLNAVRLGNEIRSRRKALGVSLTATAEISRVSRVTLHRIERGEGSVNMAAYLRVLAALGLDFQLVDTSLSAIDHRQNPASIPVRISLAAYPVLKSLAWQIQGTDSLTPQEAWDIYDRNWRHADLDKTTADELALMESLRQVFGGKSLHV